MIPAGIIHQKNNFYTARIVGNCGEFSAQELIAIAQIASTYGNGKITATSRGTIEIEQISPDNIESMLAEIKAHNLRLGQGLQLELSSAVKVLLALRVYMMYMLWQQN